MTDRRQLSEQSRRFNAMIADAVMRAEAEGIHVVPGETDWRSSPCMCPLGALLNPQMGKRMCPYPYAGTVAAHSDIDVDWAFSFIRAFEGGGSAIEGQGEAYYLGLHYRARALRMHGGGE